MAALMVLEAMVILLHRERERERERERLFVLVFANIWYIKYILCRRGLWVRQYGITTSILFHGYGNRPIFIQLRQRMWSLLSGIYNFMEKLHLYSFIFYHFYKKLPKL
jgi:hypothetical protein